MGYTLPYSVSVVGGDYTYNGHIVAVFEKMRRGEWRCVVEDSNGRLFIHNNRQVGLSQQQLQELYNAPNPS